MDNNQFENIAKIAQEFKEHNKVHDHDMEEPSGMPNKL